MPKIFTQLPPLPHRDSDVNKGACGKILVIGGSRGMAGAPCLSARAAYRSGAGLVKLAVPSCIWDIVATKTDECTSVGLPNTLSGSLSCAATTQLLQTQAAWCDVAVLGPGLSQEFETLATVLEIVLQWPRSLVLDADGLNAFSGRIEDLRRSVLVLNHSAEIVSSPKLVLTPHPGEAARLLETTPEKVQVDRPAAVLELAQRSGAIVVLKGAGTLVCDGVRLYQNTTGNSGMATGGTGDVLAGVIAALIGQKLDSFEAACLGVYIHGLAGDIVAREKGKHSLIASDLIDALPLAFTTFQAAPNSTTIA
jgi:NAD(P)H-hydrate epimerase